MSASATILTDAPVIAFVPTKDFGAARRFYETTLGLRLLAQDEFALLFEAAGTRIRVVKTPEFRPAPFTVLGWRIGDAAQAVSALAARGVKFEQFPGMKQDPAGIWDAPSGARVAWFKDPDGNLLSVSQQS